jgi:hypothetical protein
VMFVTGCWALVDEGWSEVKNSEVLVLLREEGWSSCFF